MYVKFIDSKNIEYPPTSKMVNGFFISSYNCNETMLFADGYKPFEDSSMPNDGKRYEYNYVDGEIITREWVENPYTPEEVRIAALEEQMKNLIDGNVYAQLAINKEFNDSLTDFINYVISISQ